MLREAVKCHPDGVNLLGHPGSANETIGCRTAKGVAVASKTSQPSGVARTCTYPTSWFAGLFALGAFAATAAGCSANVDAGSVAETEDDQTSWVAPAETSCEAKGIRKVANEATLAELDIDAKLDKRAAENIIAARPFQTVRQIDDVALVGGNALSAILVHARAKGHVASCPGSGPEIGVVSDLDKTVIPEAKPDLAKAPYPGIKTLYQLLEHRNGGAAGDVYYVTARKPERVTAIPAYLEAHGVPGGVIETGTSGMPWIAQPEKVRDIKGILQRTGTQRFVLLGDTAQRDPEVYKEIRAAHPERVIAIFIQKVDAVVPPARVEGMILHESYAEVAASLYGLEVITRDEARSVMVGARSEGLALTDAQMDGLLERNKPKPR